MVIKKNEDERMKVGIGKSKWHITLTKESYDSKVWSMGELHARACDGGAVCGDRNKWRGIKGA